MHKAFTITAKIVKSRIDVKKRMVWGVATIEDDVPDLQGDIVEYPASLKAFASWPRNVREMHTNKAVGRCISVVPIHSEKKILVGVHISEGAEDTWKKILDGTLRAFSIGGYPRQEKKKWNVKANKFANHITNYVLTELSIVDSPANPGCEVTLVTKRNGRLVASDILSDVSKGGPPQMKTPKQVTKGAATVRDFVKSNEVAEGDELVIVRKSDLAETEVDGKKAIIFKGDVPVQTIAKEDAEGIVPDLGEHEDEGGEENLEAVDLEEIAENLLQAHDALHELAGQECKCGSEEGDEQGGDEGFGDENEGEEGVGKGQRGGRLRKNRHQRGRTNGGKEVTSKQVENMIAKAVGATQEALTDVFAKRFDALEAKLGGGTAPQQRKGGEGDAGGAGNVTANALFQKSDGTPNDGTVTAPANGVPKNDQEAIALIEKNLRDVRGEANTLVKLRDGGHTMTPEQSIRLESIGDDLAKAKIAYQRVTGKDPATLA